MLLRDRLRAAGFRAARRVLALRRPSPRANRRALHARGESIDALTLRPAGVGDVPALVALHVAAWNDTYAPLVTGPSVDTRERQWRHAFGDLDGWFCHVLARSDGTLVGFTKGVFRPGHEIPGQLDKLFLARDYQRMGLGLRLVGGVVRRFLEANVPAMAAYVDPRNPSCGFFERLGGRWLIEPDGHANFSWYAWNDLPALARRCVMTADRSTADGPE
jgi:GNAT superfamily N-acetyltransferase